MSRLAPLGSLFGARRTRTVLTVVSIAIGFVIFGVVDGVRASLVDARSLGVGADRFFVNSRISPLDQLPFTHLAKIEEVPGVTAAITSTVFAGYFQDPKNDVPAFAVDDVARQFAVFSEFRFRPEAVEQFRRMPTAAIVGRKLAERFQWQVGDRISLHSRIWTRRDGSADWPFDIVGLYDTPDPATAVIFIMNYSYLDEERPLQKGTVSMIALRVADVSRGRAVCDAIDALFANSADQTYCQSERALQQSRLRTLSGVGIVARAVAFAALLTALFLCTNALAQSVRERRREYATLKVLGWSQTSVGVMILLESTLLCLGSAVAGLLAAGFVLHWLPASAGHFELAPITVYTGLGLALAIALACGVPQAFKAARAPISDAWSVQ